MITNTNNTIISSNNNLNYDIERYIGVAALHVLAVNPDMATLNKYGANIGIEPEYVKTYTSDNGTERKAMNLRMLCRIDDLPDYPIVSLYFRLGESTIVSNKGGKQTIKVIDRYGNTAWVTNEQFKNKELPEYRQGKMENKYKPAHAGEEELVTFLRRYLNVAPYEKYDRQTGTYVPNPNPGVCCISKWNELINGDVSEIENDLKKEPNNLLRVILGVRKTDDNKTYQCFISDTYISYGASPVDGVYASAEKAIARWHNNERNKNEEYSAEKVKPYVVKPTKIENTTDDIDKIFADSDDVDDLPFGD